MVFKERTEEKKKIFELAGGKKKVDQDRDRDHRKTIQYLPIIEQQRREPWRTFNEVSWSCLCPQVQLLILPPRMALDLLVNSNS